MKSGSALKMLAMLAFLFTCDTLASAQDVTRKLEAVGSFENAVRSGDASALPPPVSGQDLQARADQLTHEYRMHQERNKVYEILILSGLALGSLFLVLRFIGSRTPNSGAHIVNATGLICIIFGTILLVIMAQSDQQLTAAVGILGAVAGYLFRSMHRGDDDEKTGQTDQKPGAGTRPN